jgi:cyclopropane fatty-acyl-phospholipid synthase-like methyltransferase
MSDQIIKILELPEHPFFIGPVSEDDNHIDLPKSLPFSMGIHPRYVIPRLVMNADISDALQKAYAYGSMASTPLGESNLANVRMNEVIEKLLELLGGSFEGKKILEIGCGNGELLHQLQERGAVVKGLEIGPQAAVVEERYGIPVVTEPMIKGRLNEKFDCIFSYGCLEHIEDIDTFFEGSRSCLVNNGLFFHSVPNSELSFNRVHTDHLLHEHINYYTHKNGVALLEAQAFVSATSCLTKNQNELMLWGYYDESTQTRWPLENFDFETKMLEKYAEKLSDKFSAIMKAIRNYIDAGESIGFYAGGFEYGFYLQENKQVRYFDGDDFKYGKKWLFDLPAIEAPIQLLDRKVDKIIICKPHYFKDIYDALVSIGVDPNSLVNIESITNTK